MNNKNAPIKDNPSTKQLKGEMAIASVILKTCKLFGMKYDDMPDIKAMRKQLDDLAKLPDEFNTFFADKGWIAYESFHVPTMQVAIELMKQGDAEAAENEILSYYKVFSNIRMMIVSRGSVIEAYKPRKQLALYALEEYENGRYYACVPLLLMIIDGIVNDISKETGFFAEKTDLTSWDSIAGHHTGLTKLKNIYNQSRKKTNNDEIKMPFRNGILHGRDLNFNNIYVAAKCWGCLGAVIDWGKDIADGKKNAPPPEPLKTLKESWNEIKNSWKSYEASKQANEEVHKKVEKWEPREFDSVIMSVENISSTDLPDWSPEKSVVEFFELWQKKNYGFMADRTWYNQKFEPRKNKIAEIKNIVNNKSLLKYRIFNTVDEAPVISEVYIDLSIEYSGQQFEKQIKFRMIYEGENVVHGDEGGEWKMINGYYDIEYLS